MRSVGLKALKNTLSEYLRLAADGETVLVTDRDRVVAELVPPRSGRSPISPMRFSRSGAGGLLTLPLITASGAPARKPVMPLRDLLDELRRNL